MESELDAFLAESFDDAGKVVGLEELVIAGDPLPQPLRIEASVNEVGTTEELTPAGAKISYSLTVVAALGRFRNIEPKAGMTVQRRRTGRTYRIVGEVHRDSLAFTFALDSIHT